MDAGRRVLGVPPPCAVGWRAVGLWAPDLEPGGEKPRPPGPALRSQFSGLPHSPGQGGAWGSARSQLDGDPGPFSFPRAWRAGPTINFFVAGSPDILQGSLLRSEV